MSSNQINQTNNTVIEDHVNDDQTHCYENPMQGLIYICPFYYSKQGCKNLQQNQPCPGVHIDRCPQGNHCTNRTKCMFPHSNFLKRCEAFDCVRWTEQNYQFCKPCFSLNKNSKESNRTPYLMSQSIGWKFNPNQKMGLPAFNEQNNEQEYESKTIGKKERIQKDDRKSQPCKKKNCKNQTVYRYCHECYDKLKQEREDELLYTIHRCDNCNAALKRGSACLYCK